MARTPSRPVREPSAGQSPYARPDASRLSSLRRSTSLLGIPSYGGFRNFLSNSFASFRGSQASLPMTNQDLRSESGSEDGWEGQPTRQVDAPQPTIAEYAVAEASGSNVRSVSAKGTPSAQKTRAPLSSKRRQAQLQLQKSAERFDLTQPGYGLVSPDSPIFPGAYGSRPDHDISRRNESASSSNGPNAISRIFTPPKHAVEYVTEQVKRLVSPSKETAPELLKRPREGEAATPSQPPATASRSLPSAAPRETTTPFAFRPAAQVTPSTHAAPTPADDAAAASRALEAYLANKPHANWTAADLSLIEQLSRRAQQELHESQSRSRATPSSSTGGGVWAASNFDGTPRLIRPLPSGVQTPAPATPFRGFSLGTATPGSAPGSVRGQKVYLGPGMSARRSNGLRTPLKPVSPFDPSQADESVAKKRRTDGDESFSVRATAFDVFAPPPRQPSPVPPVPALPAEIPRSAAAVGKKRATDIMLDLLDAEIGPFRPERQSIIVNPYDQSAPAASSSASTQPVAPRSPMRTSTPSKSALSKSTAAAAGTPARGAAARLEHTPGGWKLTTLEILQGKTPWELSSEQRAGMGAEGSARRQARRETPEVDDERDEVEEMFVDTPSRPSGRAADMAGPSKSGSAAFTFGAPAARAPKDAVEKGSGAAQGSSSSTPFTFGSSSASVAPAAPKQADPPTPAYKPVGLNHSSLPAPSSTPRKTQQQEEDEYMPVDTASYAPPPAQSSASFTFKPTPPTPAPQPENEAGSFVRPTSAVSVNKAEGGTFLSAKDAARAVAIGALPFFTFSHVAEKGTGGSASAKAKTKAMEKPLQTFTFTLDAPAAMAAAAAPASGGFNWAAAGAKPQAKQGGTWTCDVCGLQTPESQGKCVACETPRPGGFAAVSAPAPAPASAPAPAVLSGGFNWSAAGAKPQAKQGGTWLCGVCGLSTPETQSKCVACEAPKPGASASAAPSAGGASGGGGGGGGGFDWSAAGGQAPKAKQGTWTCGVCACQTPEGKDACDVCETPRG